MLSVSSVLFCFFILPASGRSLHRDGDNAVTANIDDLTEEEVFEYTSRDHFGLEGEVYRNTRTKAKEYRILYANIHNTTPPVEPYLSSVLFGDIIYTEDQLSWLLEQLKRRHRSRQKRKAINYDTYPSKKWKGNIPYTFSNTYSHSEREKDYIRKCLKFWENETCIRFVEFNHSSTRYSDYVYIERKIGCYSHYGRVGGRQLLGLGPTCLMTNGYGYVIHEIGHVIGLFHEHSRYDRDDHVTIYENNIRPGEIHNFMKFDENELRTFGLPYDYTSVMHYGSRSFSIDGEDTIRTLDPLYQMTIGQRYKQSYLDVKAVNLAYCQDRCGRAPLPCQRGGYVDPNNCQTCKCPDGYNGTICQHLMASSTDVCPYPGLVSVTRRPSCLRVGPYNDNTHCTWLLKEPNDCQIQFWFEGEFSVLQGATSGPTCSHYVEVRYKGEDTKPGPRFCGNRLPTFDKLTSERGEILINFRTPQTMAENKTFHGFTMCYKTADTCTAEDAVVTSYSTTKYQSYTPPTYTSSRSFYTTTYRRHTTSGPVQDMTSSPHFISTTTRWPFRATSSDNVRLRTTSRLTSSTKPPIATSVSRSGYTLDNFALQFRLPFRTPSDYEAIRSQTASSVDLNKRTTESAPRTTAAGFESRRLTFRSYRSYGVTPHR